MLRRLTYIAVSVAAVLLTGLAWGADGFIHVGDVQSLDIQVRFNGYLTASDGSLRYHPGKSVSYTVEIINRANQSFSPIEVQSSLHSDGATCQGNTLAAGSRLPGNSLSSPYTFSLSPGQSYRYDASYDVPATVCGTANLAVRVQYQLRNRPPNAATRTSPARLKFE